MTRLARVTTICARAARVSHPMYSRHGRSRRMAAIRECARSGRATFRTRNQTVMSGSTTVAQPTPSSSATTIGVIQRTIHGTASIARATEAHRMRRVMLEILLPREAFGEACVRRHAPARGLPRAGASVLPTIVRVPFLGGIDDIV